MRNIAIAIHGGAGEDSSFIRENRQGYEQGLKDAAEAGHEILKNGGKALDAVCAAVRSLENNILFNAGRGSAINHSGIIEMDAGLMNGEDLKAGAVAMVRLIKNPIDLARQVMEKTDHVLLAGYGAAEFARTAGIAEEAASYFISRHQLEELENARNEAESTLLRKPVKGTVGAVALDVYGNVAAGTSTGGTCNSLPGRIGDSCIIGAGCYANNASCAVSGTGDGELLIREVIAHHIAVSLKYKNLTIQEACDYVIKETNVLKGDLGVIAVTPAAEVGISFNSERMHRAWIDGSGRLNVSIYP
jgi:beta-aspartyl-peptidase (threonine type)